MSARTDIQIITQDGRPAFVVIPYEEYIRTHPGEPRVPENGYIPNEVVKMVTLDNLTLARAWREYLGLTQVQVAERLGITQAALSQMESGAKRMRKASVEKLAAALGVQPGQLMP
ncbi:MAG TPA: type II toxin-antitoxin system prevent-host-death family antitoxin [Deltaproteobacteria bacterium]|nr:type II toxin-antitoxin system prevent-host-death family antitoxin [Deltaproteobacteria bacterium]